MDGDATDEQLIGRVVAGRDMPAFGVLVERYQNRVHGYLSRLCASRTEADDMAQDTFMKVWDKLGSFRGDGSFEGWLLRIAHTTFLQELRKRSRRREQSLEASDRAVAEALAQRRATAGDDWPDLERLLNALTPEIRSMMILVYGMGYTLGEVADIVGMPVGTVKSHLSRAKARLRNDFDLQGVA